MAMIAASTHPFANWRAQSRVDKERYNVLARDMQALAARLVICGMHVHVGIEDDELRIDLMNQATYFLPHLLALSTSSPFWEGQPTGLKAYRPTVFGDLPRSGLPEHFASADEWHQHAAPAGADRAVRRRHQDLVGHAPERQVPDPRAADLRHLHPARGCDHDRRALAVDPAPRSTACARATRPGGATGGPWSRRTSGSPSAMASAPSSPTSASWRRSRSACSSRRSSSWCATRRCASAACRGAARARDPRSRHQRRPPAHRLREGAGRGRRRARGAQAVVDWLIEETMVGIDWTAPAAAAAAPAAAPPDAKRS